MDFEPTPGQADALTMITKLLQVDGPAHGTLTGFAGTGKTTLLGVVAAEHGNPLVLTPTGKAALRVKEATDLPAMTIHKWLYKVSEDRDTGLPRWTKKSLDEIGRPANDLLVIDEASMLDQDVWLDVWSVASALGFKVLIVGDRFQLPPVTKRPGKPWSALTDVSRQHRADLTEVVRQALDSPILRASMALRSGETEAMDAIGTDLPVVPRTQLVERFLELPAGNRALITHRNTTRHALNGEVRAALGHGDQLVAGEPLLVLFNNYFLDRFNGEVVTFQDWVKAPEDVVTVRDRWKNLSVQIGLGIANVEGAQATLSPDEVFGRTAAMPETTISKAAKEHALSRWGYSRANPPPSHLNANLGYALTAHKAQGSEYAGVAVVLEDSLGAAYTLPWRRWVYTAATRGKQTVFLCYG